MTEKKPNHLINENSPYLLQHAYNPVDWHPWGSDALNIANEQSKLMIISIGYAACHWCHVMEHESFEDEEVAAAMNRDFVSVKVDREERPDIDHIYMAAAYATTGRGGWPLNVIALPDQRPVFAGTYFSKHDWLSVLKYFNDIFKNQPGVLIHQASEISSGMKKMHNLPYPADPGQLDKSLLHEIFSTWEDDLDFVHGGTHGAPKFPMPVNNGYLLWYGTIHHNAKALKYTEVSLDKMAMGGIYDHLGGGFSRYSVDAQWHVPHFEKMLYDNAQLISLYSLAYTATKKQEYKQVVEESIAFIERELTSPDGLFYASLDADSEGTEGAFYTWTSDEMRKYLGDNSGIFLDYYSCEEKGNWEHSLNVLRKSTNDANFAARYDISVDQLAAFIDVCKDQLFTVRGKRIRPATDDKILTCWNALMISALSQSAGAFNKPHWLERAITAADFYRKNVTARNGKLWRNSKAGSFAIAGFLDDYSFLIKSFLDIYRSNLDNAWLASAELLTGEVLLHFTAADGTFFNLSSDEETRLIQDTVELSDNVIPASNSQMARNLFILGYLLNKQEYTLRSVAMLKKMVSQIKRNPSFHANWVQLLADHISGPTGMNIVGDEKILRLQEFSACFLPHVIFSGNQPVTSPGVGESNMINGKTLIYVCRDKTCFSPVETVREAIQILGKL
ncbi:MAG: thioredoxin domain-containing protein [Bacteroidales bacterium]|nr:thioredoxin domain-containing protein [Bacteroidales bacterium]